MDKITSHRGPDGAAVFIDGNISLGHNRLSIIDLSASASQPMHSNDGSLVIVFNGEIYNFLKLKEELGDFYQFKTNSDTEVILAAYKKWGKDCAKKLSGIFAFVIWDKEKKELFLARDYAGIKPLYYFFDGDRFIFSSEIKAILEHNIPRILNREAFNHYLRLLYVPEPLTMFMGINKFPAASFGVFRDKKLVISKYWELPRAGYFSESKNQIAENLRNLISKSVKNQLVSDRPLGIYLSGGIDSSVVLDCVSRVRSNIDTFSVGFELSADEQKDKFNKDFELARRTAKHYGTNHNEVILAQDDVLDIFDEAVRHMDEPISNPTAIAMMKLAGFAKNKADVVLGGDGGDELFGGYERYRLSLISGYFQKLPKTFRDAMSFSDRFKKLNTPPGIERFAMFMFQKEEVLGRVINASFLNNSITKDEISKNYFSSGKDNNFEEVFMDTDRKSWLKDFSLMLTDKMSMAYGLEARVPLLDRDVSEFSARIPLKYKISPFNTKIILKKAFQNNIPDYLLNQPKRGWFSPGAKWLRNDRIDAMAKNMLSEGYYSETAPLFNWNNIDAMRRNHYEKKEYNFNTLWALMTFQSWAKQFKVRII